MDYFSKNLYFGLDVPKDSIAVAYAPECPPQVQPPGSA
jgi:hypothetical protein